MPRYPYIACMMVTLTWFAPALADCSDDIVEFTTECNNECPADEGGPVCHALCHVHATRMRASCKTPPPKKEDKNKTTIGRGGECFFDACPTNPWFESKPIPTPRDPCIVDGCPIHPPVLDFRQNPNYDLFRYRH